MCEFDGTWQKLRFFQGPEAHELGIATVARNSGLEP